MAEFWNQTQVIHIYADFSRSDSTMIVVVKQTR